MDAYSLLEEGLKNGNINTVINELSKYNKDDLNIDSALNMAVMGSNPHIAKAAITLGAKVDGDDNENLIWSILTGDSEIFKSLYAGSNIDDDKINSLLYEATLHNRKEIVVYLLEKGADMNDIFVSTSTGLHNLDSAVGCSIKNDRAEIFNIFCDYGYDKDKNINMDIVNAANYKSFNIVSKLISGDITKITSFTKEHLAFFSQTTTLQMITAKELSNKLENNLKPKHSEFSRSKTMKI